MTILKQGLPVLTYQLNLKTLAYEIHYNSPKHAISFLTKDIDTASLRAIGTGYSDPVAMLCNTQHITLLKFSIYATYDDVWLLVVPKDVSCQYSSLRGLPYSFSGK